MLSSGMQSEMKPDHRRIENIVGSFMTIESGLVSNRSEKVRERLNDSEMLYNQFKRS